MSSFLRFAGRTAAPAMAAVYSSNRMLGQEKTKCEAPQQPAKGFQKDAPGYFYNLIPQSQLYQPKFPYPMWDDDWDQSTTTPTTTTGNNDKLDRRRRRYLRKHGVTKHIILIRHGQYDETYKEDEKRILTQVGRQQAHETGKRLAEMLAGIGGDEKSPCNISVVRVSNMARAKETADIIASHIPKVARSDPDPLLNEGRPAHNIPGAGRVSESTILKTQEGHKRIEEAFQKYFHRAESNVMPQEEDLLDESSELPPPADDSLQSRHEYEIIVCHANVIRYFLCRALQLPPEAWLRLCTFNCSLTYLTIRPTGGVSCRLLGDVGHLPPKLVSFSGHHGFNW